MGKSLDLKKYLHIFMTFFLMLLVGHLPPIGCITPLGMQILGIFVGAMYGWTFSGLIWPSLLAMIMIGFTDYSTVNAVLSNGAGHQTVIFVLFLYIFCGVLEESGITSILGQYIVSLKIAQGRPYVLLALLCLGAWLMGGLVSIVGSTLIFWNIFYDICAQLNYTKKDLFPKLGIIGIIYSSILGSTIFLFKLYPVIMMGVYQSITGKSIDFLKFSASAIIVTLLLVGCYLLICKFILRPKVSNAVINIEKPEGFTSLQKKVVGLLIALIVMFVLPSILPQTWTITQIFNQLGQNGILAVIVIACFLITDQGKPIMNIKEAIYKGMSWEIYFLLFAVFQLSAAMTSDATGIIDFIVKLMDGVLGNRSAIVFCFMAIAIGGIMSNIISNTVTPMIMIPLVLAYAGQAGVSPEVIIILLTIMMSDSIILPSGSAFAGLLLANDWVEVMDIYKYGFLFLCMTILIIAFVGTPIVSVIINI